MTTGTYGGLTLSLKSQGETSKPAGEAVFISDLYIDFYRFILNFVAVLASVLFNGE